MATTTRSREVPPLEATLSYQLHLLHKLSDRDSQHAYQRELGLSLADGRCLATVGAFAPLSVVDLARRANLNKGQASRAAQALVEQGLVRKAGNEHDGRGVVLDLTTAGRRLWIQTMMLIARRNDEIFAGLDASERRIFGELLERLVRHNQRA